MLTRRQILQVTAAAAGSLLSQAATFPSAASKAGAGNRPNIVLILADDLGWGELGCFGQEIISTPNLDRMAGEGVRFTDFYSAAPICAPSRCSLLTGRHQGTARVRHNTFNEIPATVQADLRPEDTTFAEVLSAAGYATGMFGKWGFGPDDESPMTVVSPVDNEGHFSHPLQKGFDEFNGFIYHHHATNGYWADYWWEGNKRVDIPENEGGAKGRYNPDTYTERGLDFMERQVADGKTFALWLPTILPHTPNEVPDHSQYDDLPYGTDTKKHAAMVTKLDTHVGMVLDKLEELGIADNTLVFFTSDNGPHNETTVYGGTDPLPVVGATSAADDIIFEANGPFRGVKQNLYEGGIRMPTIAWGPGVLGKDVKGTVNDHQWATFDLLATFAAFGGASLDGVEQDGISHMPLLTGQGQQVDHEYLYWERFRAGAPTPLYIANDRGRHGKFVQAVRKGKWKCLRWAPGTNNDGSIDFNPAGTLELIVVPIIKVPKEYWEIELYDLEADPGETNNLALTNDGIVDELIAHMEQAHQEPEAA
ncbi:MAG: arylsulfatase A [Glaciecola sp.]|jgi:arylsulfatase A